MYVLIKLPHTDPTLIMRFVGNVWLVIVSMRLGAILSNIEDLSLLRGTFFHARTAFF